MRSGMSTIAPDDHIADIIDDLLTIAEVAMPIELFETDPRIIKAQALLAKLRGEIQ